MMAQVIHEWDKMAFLERVRPALKRFSGKRIAIKLHFGEPGNKTAFTPGQVKPITDLLRELNVEFFLYDSSVAYTSPRSRPESHRKAALERGWGSLGEVRTDDDFFKVKGKYLTYEVCSPLMDAGGVLVLSHVKGHQCSGFGGAIKNLGMGCLSKRSKSAIHDGGKPVLTGECDACGVCAANCPWDGIEVREKAEFVSCFGCSNCVLVCPRKALTPAVATFDELLADGANAAAPSFKDVYYISFLGNITFQCDCWEDSKEIVAPDCGWLACEDPVAIDKATHDIITAAAGEDVFLKSHGRSGLSQIEAAERIGLGHQRYII